MKAFSDFLRTHFSNNALHQTMKAPLIVTVKMISKKFGERAINDLPPQLLKELEASSNES